MIKHALKQLDIKQLKADLVSTGKWTENSINVAFSRGKISKDMAYEMEGLTKISFQFWMMPEKYRRNGERR